MSHSMKLALLDSNELIIAKQHFSLIVSYPEDESVVALGLIKFLAVRSQAALVLHHHLPPRLGQLRMKPADCESCQSETVFPAETAGLNAPQHLRQHWET